MSSVPPDDVRIPPGTIVLDKYRVERTIGIGGMGLVVQATHATLGTKVAIKFLLPQFAVSHDAARRFVREAQAASKIQSDHISRVFDTGTSQPYGPYIVMEFLEGSDLSRHLKMVGALSVETAIDLTVQAASGLAEAHALGIVHRDVKPANLFVIEKSDGSPFVKVLDFGISKVTEEASLEVTKTTAILGSGLYMSPEQMRSAKNVDLRTDVYALGITLFELLARTQPFTAESFPELCIKVNMEPPSELRQFRPDIDPNLAQVIARGYAKQLDQRYQTMADFAQALAPWAAPSTQPLIERVLRASARRAGSSPSLPPAPRGSVPPAPNWNGDLLIPRPPSLPTPSSVGVDTFGLSNPRHPLGQTSAKSFGGSKGKSSGGLLGIGIGVGALLAVGAAAAYVLWFAPANIHDEPTAAAAGADSAVVPTESAAAVVVAPSDSMVVPASASPSTEAAGSAAQPTAVQPSAVASSAAQLGPSAAVTHVSAPTTTAAAGPPPVETATPVVTAVPTGPAAPCRIRDLDGTLKDCPR